VEGSINVVRRLKHGPVIVFDEEGYQVGVMNNPTPEFASLRLDTFYLLKNTKIAGEAIEFNVKIAGREYVPSEYSQRSKTSQFLVSPKTKRIVCTSIQKLMLLHSSW
jgi:hypothetical protein